LAAQQTVIQTMNTSAVCRALPELVRQVARQETRIVVEENGQPVAALISTEDLARLTALDQQRARDFAILEASQAAFADVSPDELEAEISRAIAAVRAESRERTPRS
jgi:prevent-host-death family protein